MLGIAPNRGALPLWMQGAPNDGPNKFTKSPFRLNERRKRNRVARASRRANRG